MTPSPKKKMVMYPKIVFPHFLRKCCSLRKKLLDEKIFESSFPIKKVIFIFVVKCPLPFERDFGPRNNFSVFSGKYSFFFFEKTVK